MTNIFALKKAYWLQPVDSIENSVHITPLPQLLKDHGYYTVHSGKAHFGAIGTPAEYPENIGFDVNIAGHAAGAPGSYLGENNYSRKRRNRDRIWDTPGLEKYHGTDTYLTEALTLEAIDAIKYFLKKYETSSEVGKQVFKIPKGYPPVESDIPPLKRITIDD